MAKFPVRLGPAEETLIAQLKSVGADQAAERITVAGLPTRRVEAYHYTDLKTLLRSIPPLATPANEASAPALRIPGAYTVMIANGVIQNASTAPAGVIVGKAEGGVLTNRDDAIVGVNNALTNSALSLTLEGSVDPVIQVERRIEGEAAHVADALKVFVADGASATIIETFSGSDAAHVGNHATYMALGKNAVVTHVSVDLSARAATHFSTNEYHLADGARLRTLVIHLGAGLARTNVYPTLGGADAHTDITGLNLVSDGQHADITMETHHAVPHTIVPAAVQVHCPRPLEGRGAGQAGCCPRCSEDRCKVHASGTYAERRC
jgi:ABC-type transport system involved in Fe-S cluster assembly, permease component